MLMAPLESLFTKNVAVLLLLAAAERPVAENGRAIGIVTRSDTMRYLYDLLPE